MAQFEKHEKDNSLKSLKKFIIYWNNKYPVDRLWRLKRNVAFGSLEHRQMSLIDMRIEIDEEKMFVGYFENINKFEDGKKLYDKTGEWLKSPELKEEVDKEMFDKLDIDTFNIDGDIKFN